MQKSDMPISEYFSVAYRYFVQKIKILLSHKQFFLLISIPLTFGILGWLVWRQKEVLLNYQWNIQGFPILSAFFLYTVILMMSSLVWTWMMHSVGDNNLGFWKHFRVFCISALGKRLPGTVWYIGWRAQIYSQDGYSLRVVSLTSGIEVAVSTISAVIVSLIFAIPILLHYQFLFWGLIAIIGICVLAAQPRVFRWFRKRLHIENEVFSRKEFLIWTLIYVIIRILVGTMFYCVINIIIPIPVSNLPYVIGTQAIVATLSMLLFFFPSNFGFAEVSLSLLLSSLMPSSIAVIVIIANRIIMVLFEAIFALQAVVTELILKKRI